MTTSVTRPCFWTQHQTCKTKTTVCKTETKTAACKTKIKTDFFLSHWSCPKTDGLRPRHCWKQASTTSYVCTTPFNPTSYLNRSIIERSLSRPPRSSNVSLHQPLQDVGKTASSRAAFAIGNIFHDDVRFAAQLFNFRASSCCRAILLWVFCTSIRPIESAAVLSKDLCPIVIFSPGRLAGRSFS